MANDSSSERERTQRMQRPGQGPAPLLARLAPGEVPQARDLPQPSLSVPPKSPAEMLEPGRPPRPPRQRKPPRDSRIAPFIRFLSRTLTLLLFISATIGIAAIALSHQFEQPGPLPATTVVVIPKGEGINGIADRLEREKVIADSRIFVANALWHRAHNRLKSGEYEIKKGASMRQVLDILIEGKSVSYKITIPEGMTSFQIVERIKANPDLTGELKELPPEGVLLPDTYKFGRGMSRQELVERMQAEGQKFLARAWANRQKDLPVRTPEEALILASIIEKETGRADERERVAAVFVNRLRKGMRLQSDPTIIYGIVGGQGPLGRGILRSEIEARTPYNTYQIDGLPPTPICNPGRAAIEATLNPAKTSELFFVADGTGGHVFAATLTDHNRNVANWRRIEREAKAQRANQQQAVASGLGQGTGAAAAAAADQPAEAAAPAGQVAAAPAPSVVVAPTSPGPLPAAPAPPAQPPQAAPAATAPGSDGASAIPLPVRKPKRASTPAVAPPAGPAPAAAAPASAGAARTR